MTSPALAAVGFVLAIMGIAWATWDRRAVSPSYLFGGAIICLLFSALMGRGH